MIKKLNKMRAEKGFTLAELLVVVLIIAILATVAIVFFTGQTDKASTAAANANLRSAYSAAQNLYLDNNGSYIATGATGADPEAKAQSSVESAIETNTNLDAVGPSATPGEGQVKVDMVDGESGTLTVIGGASQNLPN